MKTQKPWFRLNVEEEGDWTYRVESESGNAPYMVDLKAIGGQGQCDCSDFQCRVGPVLSGRKTAPKDNPLWAPFCKHLIRAILHAHQADMVGLVADDKSANYKGP